MRSKECRYAVLDEYYKRSGRMIRKLDRYYRRKTNEELRLIRAQLVREQNMLGNIPLLASTTPIVFLVFGTQVSKYFPHDSIEWLVVAMISLLVIVWSINHHFRVKGRVHLDLYLLDEILKDRSKNEESPVQ